MPHDIATIFDETRQDARTCTFCNQPYSVGKPQALVPGTSTVYGHATCIAGSTIGMKAIVAPLTLEEMLDRAQASLDAYMDADGQPLMSDLHAAADWVISARMELRRSTAESTTLVTNA